MTVGLTNGTNGYIDQNLFVVQVSGLESAENQAIFQRSGKIWARRTCCPNAQKGDFLHPFVVNINDIECFTEPFIICMMFAWDVKE